MTTRNFTKIVRLAKNASHCILVVWAHLIYHIMIDNEQVVNSIYIQQMTLGLLDLLTMLRNAIAKTTTVCLPCNLYKMQLNV